MENAQQHPACFGSRKDYELWLDSQSSKKVGRAGPCVDCLPSFKMRMAKAGRCQHPETVFSFEPSIDFAGVEVGIEIVGHWKSIPVLEKKAAPQVPAKATGGTRFAEVDSPLDRIEPATSVKSPSATPAVAAPICKCGEPCQLYGGIGGYSVSCAACNEKNAARQRVSRAHQSPDIEHFTSKWRQIEPDQMLALTNEYHRILPDWLEGESIKTVRGRATAIVVAAMFVGPHPRRIAELIGISLSPVICAAADLYDYGIWTADGKVVVSCDIKDDATLEIEMILHALVIEGVVEPVREPRKHGICVDCEAKLSPGAGKRCRVCYRARSCAAQLLTWFQP